MAPASNIKAFVKRASFRKKKEHSAAKAAEKAKLLNENEENKLRELKELIQDETPLNPRYTDLMLLGFLKARCFDVEEAKKLFNMDINYRRFLGADDLLSDYEMPEVNQKFQAASVIGFDKEGSLIRFLNIGYADIKGFVNSLSTLEQLKLILWYMESDFKMQQEENKKTGKNMEQFLYIINLENLVMGQIMYKPALDTLLLGVKLLQDHFHEIAKSIIVINAPSFFATVYKLFKPVIMEDLQKRLRIFDTDGWQEELLKCIDADTLPVFLGGNRLDINNDPKCPEFIFYGGAIPESYYVTPEDFLDPEDPEVVTATIPAGSFLNFRFPVEDVNSKLWWHIQAKDNDIGLGVFKEPFTTGLETPRTQSKKKEVDDMSKLEQVTPIIRIQCHVKPEVGETRAFEKCTYILHFDNTYSWMNAKIVTFKVGIKPLDESG